MCIVIATKVKLQKNDSYSSLFSLLVNIGIFSMNTEPL